MTDIYNTLSLSDKTDISLYNNRFFFNKTNCLFPVSISPLAKNKITLPYIYVSNRYLT